MEEKKIIKDETTVEVNDTEVSLEKEEENKGIGYEVVIGSI